MSVKITRRDWVITTAFLLFSFGLAPFLLEQLFLFEETRFKKRVHAIVPDIVSGAEEPIAKVKDLMLAEVISYDGYNIYTAPNTRAAIDDACHTILKTITGLDYRLSGNKEFCDFYIQRDEWIRADNNTIIATQYPYDLQDFDDLLSSGEKWRLYPNGVNWRVKYILQRDPVVILDFEVRRN